MPKRSRSSNDDGDAGKFLDKYFRDQDMASDVNCSQTDAINARADEAREQFKKARLDAQGGPAGRDMSGSEKYERRLANNRNSAAASRVYREVQKKGFEFSLKEVSTRAKKYAEELAEMQDTVKKQDEENERLRQRILALESKQTCSPGSPIEGDADDELTGLNEFPSMFGSSQSEQRATLKYGGPLPPRNSQDASANAENVEELIRKIKPDVPDVGDVFSVGVLNNTEESPQNLRFSLDSQDKLGSQSLRFPLGSQDSVGKIEDVAIADIQDKL